MKSGWKRVARRINKGQKRRETGNWVLKQMRNILILSLTLALIVSQNSKDFDCKENYTELNLHKAYREWMNLPIFLVLFPLGHVHPFVLRFSYWSCWLLTLTRQRIPPKLTGGHLLSVGECSRSGLRWGWDGASEGLTEALSAWLAKSWPLILSLLFYYIGRCK